MLGKPDLRSIGLRMAGAPRRSSLHKATVAVAAAVAAATGLAATSALAIASPAPAAARTVTVAAPVASIGEIEPFVRPPLQRPQPPAAAPQAAPAPKPAPAAVTTSAPRHATAPAADPTYGCGPALAYLETHSAPGFTFECPGYALGHQAMTCQNVAGVCPGSRLIAINVPCAAAYMNEAHNSWVVEGLLQGPIDPYGYCH